MSLGSPAFTPVCPGASAGILPGLRQGACGRGGGNGYDQGDKSKSTGMPWGGKGPPAAAVIAEAAVALFRRCGRVLPCTRIAVSATGFTEVHTDQGTLTGFFEPGTLLPSDTGGTLCWTLLHPCCLGVAVWVPAGSSLGRLCLGMLCQPLHSQLHSSACACPARSCLPPGMQQLLKADGFLDAPAHPCNAPPLDSRGAEILPLFQTPR